MSFRIPDKVAIPRYAVIAGDHKGSGNVQRHIYPANGQVTREITLAGTQDVDQAVQAARAAFPAWRALSGDKRRDLMLKIASLIEQHSKDFKPGRGRRAAYRDFCLPMSLQDPALSCASSPA